MNDRIPETQKELAKSVATLSPSTSLRSRSGREASYPSPDESKHGFVWFEAGR